MKVERSRLIPLGSLPCASESTNENDSSPSREASSVTGRSTTNDVAPAGTSTVREVNPPRSSGSPAVSDSVTVAGLSSPSESVNTTAYDPSPSPTTPWTRSNETNDPV